MKLPQIQCETVRTRVGQSSIYFHAAGDGEPVLLLHGYAASAAWWMRNIAALAQEYRVYAPDIPGFGRSRPKIRRFSFEAMADELVAWMDQLGLEQVDLVGHSMGGQLSLYIAARYPERIKRLVLTNASGIPFHLPWYHILMNCLRAGSVSSDPLGFTALYSLLQTGPCMLWSAARALLSNDVRHMLQHIHTPTLIIWGKHDILIPLAYGQALHEFLLHSQLVPIAGGHSVMYECASLFNQLVLDYLRAPCDHPSPSYSEDVQNVFPV